MPNETVIDLKKQEETTWKKETEIKHRFKLIQYRGFMLEAEEERFHLESAVFMPDYKPLKYKGRTEKKEYLTGLAVLRTCYLYAEEHPDQKIVIIGHTDTTGPESYNVSLSQKRAGNILFLLEGNKKEWVNIVKKNHRVEDYQQILKWIAQCIGVVCDPGEVDDQLGPNTKRGIEVFQGWYNNTFDQSIAVDGILGNETWGAFFDVCIKELAYLLETDLAGLGEYRKKLKFLKENCKAVGAGESFPIEAPRQDDYLSSSNRRVEILFFESDDEPELPAGPSSKTCPKELDVIYNPHIYSFFPIELSPIPTLIWIGLQTVNEFGTRVKNFDLHLHPSGADKYSIQTDENGYWSGRVNTAGNIEVRQPDGKPVFLGAGLRETDNKKKTAVLDPTVASKAVTDIVVPGLSDDEKNKHNVLQTRYSRQPTEFRKSVRAASPDDDQREKFGKIDARGGGEPAFSRRTWGYLVADNLFIASGWDNPQKVVDLDQLAGKWLKQWLYDRHSTTKKHGYFLTLIYGRNLLFLRGDGEKVLNFELDENVQIISRYGAYSWFETDDVEGHVLFVDMNSCSGYLSGQPRSEPKSKPKQNENENEKEVSPDDTKVSEEDNVKIIYDLISENKREQYKKLLSQQTALGKIHIVYNVPLPADSYHLAMHGGTGLLENYPKDNDVNKNVHERNLSVIKNCVFAFESYINTYIDKVKKTKTEKELYLLGPPDTQFIFPYPVGLTSDQEKDLQNAQASVKDFLAYKAIGTHLCELYGVRGDGDIWLKFDIEIDSGEMLGKIIDVKYKWNWETTPEGRIRRAKGELNAGLRGGKTVKGVPYGGKLEISPPDPKTGKSEQKIHFSAGKYGFEYNVTTGEAKGSVGPFSISSNQEIKRIGFGAQLSTRELYKIFRKAQIAKGVPENKCINPDSIPAVTLGLGLQIQLLQEATIMAFLMGTRGFFERRPIMDLKRLDWASLHMDEQGYLKELKWHKTLKEAVDDESKLKPMLSSYPKNARIWDLKRVTPYNYYPKSAQAKWLDLTYAQKRASLQLLGPTLACEANWLGFWQDFAPKVRTKT